MRALAVLLLMIGMAGVPATPAIADSGGQQAAQAWMTEHFMESSPYQQNATCFIWEAGIADHMYVSVRSMLRDQGIHVTRADARIGVSRALRRLC